MSFASLASEPDSGIRDNYLYGSVGRFLQDKILTGSALSVVSAYFTIYAFEALKEQLESIDSMRFLFGEPRFVASLDPGKANTQAFKIQDEGLQLAHQLTQKQVAQECARWIAEKVQIKSVKQASLLHGKMYHILHGGIDEAIIGSSNFTVHGLGLGQDGRDNIELNLVANDRRDLKALKAWFDAIWANADLVQDVKAEVLAYLEQLYRNQSPEFVYFKTLFHIFEQFLDEQARRDLLIEQRQLVDTAIWKALFEFQRDGVRGAINKILKYNGCIIADSVGLGKTFEALAIIKYFELRNGKVLVLCPKKLRDNWTVYQAQNNSELNPFVNDRFAYTVLSHTDLSRDGGRSGDIDLSMINWGNYDLVVVDESHNFRNDNRGRRDELGNVIRKSRYERLMQDIIQSGIKTRVLLLSATPVNNDLKDLRNQVYFLTEGRDDAFAESMGVAHIGDTLAAAQRAFTEWTQQSQSRDSRDLLDKLSSAFFKLLDELTIARSRKHIQQFYQATLADLGGFPERARPISIFADIDLKNRFMSYDRLNDEISKYQLSLFIPAKYVLPEYQSRYDQAAIRAFTQLDREYYLIGMMKVNFLKRLESSVHSFAITMDRTIDKIDALIARIERFKRFRGENPALDFDELLIQDVDDEELQMALQVGKSLVYNMAHLDVDRWLHDLQQDKEQLSILHGAACQVTPERDAKLAELKRLIANKVQQPTTNHRGQPNRKVLVFTAFADTAVYLYDALKGWATEELGIHLALVTGGSVENRTTFGQNRYEHILVHFSPLSKKRAQMPSLPQEGEIDLLIATDCISEGQNLQDCDLLINYDIHWNPVRIIQRFGRIDRIGSINQRVQLVNFWPTEDLNKYIDLKNRVEARMALVDITATMADNLLRPEEIRDLIADDLTYRDRQLLRLKDEVLDLEDLSETVTLNEFTLEDFRIELTRYIESNRRLLEDAPFGLYAVVPPHPDYAVITPGVILCLRQVNHQPSSTERSDRVNPLQPYFLVYIREGGDVRFGFAQPKQILEMYRVLCAGVSTPYEALCMWFDQHTDNGHDMAQYGRLLNQAVDSIVRTFRQRAVRSLLSDRAGVLPTKQAQARSTDDFELITWLVIGEER